MENFSYTTKEKKPNNEIYEQTKARLKSFFAWIKCTSKEAVNLLPSSLIGSLGSAILLKSIFLMAEYSHRLSSEDEFNKIRENLTKYSAHFSHENYEQKYNKAVELFGVENIEQIVPEPGAMSSFINEEKKINSTLDSLHTKMFSFQEILNTPLDKTLFGDSNEELEKIKQISDSIGSKENFLEQTSWYSQSADTSEEFEISIVGNRNDSQLIFSDRDEDIKEEDTISQIRDKNLVIFNKNELKEFILKRYPKGWINREVKQLTIGNDSSFSDKETYGPNFEKRGVSANYNILTDSINMFKFNSFYKEDPQYFFEVLSHETGHANDWSADNRLSAEERLNLLLDVYKRLGSFDEHFSSYVSEINSEDLQERNYTKCVEYFAEVCEEYFSQGDLFLSPADIELVERVIKKTDPTYNIQEKLAEIRPFLKQTFPKAYKKVMGQYYHLNFTHNTKPFDFLEFLSKERYIQRFVFDHNNEIVKYWPKGGVEKNENFEFPKETPLEIKEFFSFYKEFLASQENIFGGKDKRFK